MVQEKCLEARDRCRSFPSTDGLSDADGTPPTSPSYPGDGMGHFALACSPPDGPAIMDPSAEITDLFLFKRAAREGLPSRIPCCQAASPGRRAADGATASQEFVVSREIEAAVAGMRAHTSMPSTRGAHFDHLPSLAEAFLARSLFLGSSPFEGDSQGPWRIRNSNYVAF